MTYNKPLVIVLKMTAFKILLVIIFLTTSAYLSLSSTITLQHGWDKLAHFIFYAASSIFLYFFIGNYSLACTSVTASIFEYLQKFVPNRLASVYDLLFSLTGSLFGTFIAALLFKIRRRKS